MPLAHYPHPTDPRVKDANTSREKDGKYMAGAEKTTSPSASIPGAHKHARSVETADCTRDNVVEHDAEAW